jgi:hypothetical protein
MPSTAGIRTSIRTTSGAVRRASGTTSAPSAASPTTIEVRLGASDRPHAGPDQGVVVDQQDAGRHRPRRTDRQRRGDPPLAVAGAGLERAAEDRDPLADAAQAAPGLGAVAPGGSEFTTSMATTSARASTRTPTRTRSPAWRTAFVTLSCTMR